MFPEEPSIPLLLEFSLDSRTLRKLVKNPALFSLASGMAFVEILVSPNNLSFFGDDVSFWLGSFSTRLSSILLIEVLWLLLLRFKYGLKRTAEPGFVSILFQIIFYEIPMNCKLRFQIQTILNDEFNFVFSTRKVEQENTVEEI